MKNLLGTVKLLLMSLFGGVQQVSNLIQLNTKQYLHGLLQLAKIAILFPIPFAIIGIVTGWLWLTACAGLWCTAFLTVLLLWGAPLGIIIDSLLPGKPGGVWLSISGARYVSATRGILLWESLTYWVLSIVPIRNNWSIVPICALSVVCLILMAYHWQRNSSWTKPLFWYSAVVAVIACMIAFILPEILKIWKWAEPSLPAGNEMLTMVLILAGIGILVGIIVWFFTKAVRLDTATTATAHVPASSSGHPGGGESSQGSGLKAFAWIALLGLLVFFAVRGPAIVGTGQSNRNMQETAVMLMPAPPLPQTQHYVLEVPPDRETRIPIPMGMTCDTDPLPDPARTNATPAVWVRLEGHEPFKDWAGRPSGGTKKLWSDYKYLRSAEKYPVRVQVVIRPSE